MTISTSTSDFLIFIATVTNYKKGVKERQKDEKYEIVRQSLTAAVETRRLCSRSGLPKKKKGYYVLWMYEFLAFSVSL